MCGIIGYIGEENAVSALLSGLDALEYRGYDSAGISTVEKNNLSIISNIHIINTKCFIL